MYKGFWPNGRGGLCWRMGMGFMKGKGYGRGQDVTGIGESHGWPTLKSLQQEVQ